MTTPDNTPEPNRLLARFLDDADSLTEVELETLLERAREDESFARELKEQLLLEEYLAQEYAADRQDFPAQVWQRIADEEQELPLSGETFVEPAVDEPAPESEPEPHPSARVAENALRDRSQQQIAKYSQGDRRRRLKRGLIAVALLLMIVVPGWLVFTTVLPRVAIAQAIGGHVHCLRGGESLEVTPGFQFMDGDLINTEEGATVTLLYPDETTVTLTEQTSAGLSKSYASSLSLISSKVVQLYDGELASDIAPQRDAHPMRFVTVHAEAVIRGTEIVLLTDAKQTTLRVAEGEVDFVRTLDGKSVRVVKSQTAVASPVRLEARATRPAELLLLVDPGDLPVMLLNRSGDLQATTLELRGDAELTPAALTFASGSAVIDGDLVGLADAVEASQEFSLDLVLTARPVRGRRAADVFTLGNPASGPSLRLQQLGRQLTLVVRAPDGESRIFPLTDIDPQTPRRITLHRTAEVLSVRVDGRTLLAERSESLGVAEVFRTPPRFGNADGRGAAFRGQVRHAAVYASELDPSSDWDATRGTDNSGGATR